MTVFLYEKKRRVELTLRESNNTVNWNLPMNTNDFRVFKDAHNRIEFVVRNTDRKPINMAGRKAKINLYDHRTSELLWTQDLQNINEAKGLCQLDIKPDVMADWFLQSYSYSVEIQNLDGSHQMLFVDQNENPRGYFELVQGPKFDPLPSYEVSYGELMLTAEYPNNVQTRYHYSTAFPGSLQRHNTTGLHTVAIYLDNFSGTLSIQGSVEEGVPEQNDWYDVQVLEFDKKTGMEAVSFTANLMWVRFWIHNRNDDALDPLPSNRGQVTKLVFRN